MTPYRSPTLTPPAPPPRNYWRELRAWWSSPRVRLVDHSVAIVMQTAFFIYGVATRHWYWIILPSFFLCTNIFCIRRLLAARREIDRAV